MSIGRRKTWFGRTSRVASSLLAAAVFICGLQLLGAERATAVGELGFGECLDRTAIFACTDISATGAVINQPSSVAVSPDGETIYTTDGTSELVTVFKRLPAG